MKLFVAVILGFNAVLIGGALVYYAFRGRHENRALDIDEFCADLPKDFHLKDPYVLVNGSWIRRRVQEDPSPPSN